MKRAWDKGGGVAEDMEDTAEGMCTSGLIRAAHRSRPRNDNAGVEGDTERGDAEDN